jgi:hypothetical protein
VTIFKQNPRGATVHLRIQIQKITVWCIEGQYTDKEQSREIVTFRQLNAAYLFRRVSDHYASLNAKWTAWIVPKNNVTYRARLEHRCLAGSRSK